MRYLIPPDIEFGNFGSVGPSGSTNSLNNIFSGEERSIVYDDGELRQDYITASLIEGAPEGSDLLLSPDTSATSAFSYQNESQVDPNDPSMLLFHRYSSIAPSDVVLEGSSSGALGWELNYTKYLNRRRNLGFQVGFSFAGFDSRLNDMIEVDVQELEFRHIMANGAAVPDLPVIENEDGTTSTEPYVGDQVRESVDSGDLLSWETVDEDPAESILSGVATVDSQADFRSSIYNFRAGPTYALALGNKFAVNLGAGVSAAYLSGRFTAYEFLTVSTEEGSSVLLDRSLNVTEDAEWQVGGYVDASAYYYFTERINLFSGMQVQSGSNYSQMNEEREATVDFSSQIYVHAGLGIRF